MEISWNFVSPKKWEPWMLPMVKHAHIFFSHKKNMGYTNVKKTKSLWGRRGAFSIDTSAFGGVR